MLEKSMYRVLMLSDLEEILNLERSQMGETPEDMFLEWQASWRKESLEYYLEKSWSFGYFEENQLHSYFLAQPILFFQGHMQTLWLEHIFSSSPEAGLHLLEVAYKTAREKHLQKLLLSKKNLLKVGDIPYKISNEAYDLASINTTKLNES